MLLPILYLMATRIEAPSQPARQPQLAAGHGVVAMTFGSGSSIYFTSSSSFGRTWNAPVKVAETGSLALGRHRGPRLVILKDSIVISAVTGDKKKSHEDGNLVVWRSPDRGRTWLRAGAINDVPGSAREGLHAMAAGPDGSVFAVWLDLRVKGTQLYGANSIDGGSTWSKNVPIYASPDGTICQCCHPSLSIGSDGRVTVMWRNAAGGSRDLWITSSTDSVHFGAARKLGEGTWKLEACPMDGGGLAVDGKGITSAWRRDGDIFLTEPASNTERRVGAGKDVALARNSKGETYLVWTKEGGLQVLLPHTSEPVQLSSEGGFPALVTLEDGTVLAAWETREAIATERLDP